MATQNLNKIDYTFRPSLIEFLFFGLDYSTSVSNDLGKIYSYNIIDEESHNTIDEDPYGPMPELMYYFHDKINIYLGNRVSIGSVPDLVDDIINNKMVFVVETNNTNESFKNIYIYGNEDNYEQIVENIKNIEKKLNYYNDDTYMYRHCSVSVGSDCFNMFEHVISLPNSLEFSVSIEVIKHHLKKYKYNYSIYYWSGNEVKNKI